MNFQKFSAPPSSAPSASCLLIDTKLAWISRSFARASLMFLARAAGAAVAPRCRWKMSFLDSCVMARERMMMFSRRSFWRTSQLDHLVPFLCSIDAHKCRAPCGTPQTSWRGVPASWAWTLSWRPRSLCSSLLVVDEGADSCLCLMGSEIAVEARNRRGKSRDISIRSQFVVNNKYFR